MCFCFFGGLLTRSLRGIVKVCPVLTQFCVNLLLVLRCLELSASFFHLSFPPDTSSWIFLSGSYCQKDVNNVPLGGLAAYNDFSAEQCQQTCEDTQGCASATHNSNTLQCYLNGPCSEIVDAVSSEKGLYVFQGKIQLFKLKD